MLQFRLDWLSDRTGLSICYLRHSFAWHLSLERAPLGQVLQLVTVRCLLKLLQVSLLTATLSL